MGRLEKIVVLTVLFLVAVVLGVALTPTGDSSSRSPGKGAVAQGGESQKPSEAPLAGDQKIPGLLNADALLDTKKPVGDGAAQPAPTPNPASTDLTKGPLSLTPPVPAPAPVVAKYALTLEGLEPSDLPDMMFYRWQQGDSFAALAQHYYGSKDKVTRLTKANEGRGEASIAVGERLWIPISESSKADMTADGRTYLVKKGDVLSSISQHFYGTAKKWPKILDANRDVLASPEKLKVGMTLRIPE